MANWQTPFWKMAFSLKNETGKFRSSRISRFSAMPGWQKRIFVVAAFFLPLFRLGLAIFGYARLSHLIDRKSGGTEQAMDVANLRIFGERVNQAASVMLGANNCLTRSLVLKWMLARKHVKTDLKIGVRTKNNVLTAHAWLEKDGIPVNDRVDIGRDFATFGQPPPNTVFE